MIICPKCKHENPDDTTWCQTCYTTLPNTASIELKPSEIKKELIKKENPEISKTPKTTDELLNEFLKFQIATINPNKEFMDKAFLKYIESTEKNIRSIKGWVSFFGIIVFLSVIFAILSALLAFLGILL